MVKYNIQWVNPLGIHMDVITNQIPNINQPVLPPFMHDEHEHNSDSEIDKELPPPPLLLHQQEFII